MPYTIGANTKIWVGTRCTNTKVRAGTRVQISRKVLGDKLYLITKISLIRFKEVPLAAS